MEALLDAFPDSRFNIDPKMDRAVPPLVEALRRTNAWDRVNIAAFSDRRLLQLRRAAGRPVCTSMGPAAIGRLRLCGYGVPVGPFSAACVQVPTGYRDRTLVDGTIRDRRHPAGYPCPCVDDRRAGRDPPPARSRRRRHHDGPPQRV